MNLSNIKRVNNCLDFIPWKFRRGNWFQCNSGLKLPSKIGNLKIQFTGTEKETTLNWISQMISGKSSEKRFLVGGGNRFREGVKTPREGGPKIS